MPSALRRFLRAPARVAAVGLLALTLLAAGLVQGGAAAALRHSVDASSRPLYDILVTAPDAGAAPTVLPPNSLGGGGEAMQLDDVRALRRLAGVDVVAPIAQLLVTAQQAWRMQLSAPVDPAQLTPSGQSYRVTLRLLSDDGLGERLLSEERYRVALDQSNAPQQPPSAENATDTSGMCSIGDVPIECSLFEWGPAYNSEIPAWVQPENESTLATGWSDGTTVSVSLPQSFVIDQRMTLIDPVAEQTLLGDAGAFLAPLVELGGERGRSTEEFGAWGSTNSGPFAQALSKYAEDQAAFHQELQQGPAYQEYLRVKRERGEEPALSDYLGNSQPSSPVLVADASAPAPLRAELSVESFGPVTLPLPESGGAITAPTFPAPMRNGEAGTPLGTVNHDVSALLNAFSYAPVSLPWPGSSPADTVNSEDPTPGFLGFSGAVLVDDFRPAAVGRDAGGDITARINGVGFRTIASPSGGNSGLATRADPSAPGAETAYSGPRDGGGARPESALESGVPVGSLSAADISAIAASANGIPLGAYGAVDAVLVEDADGERVAPTPMTSTLSALGLVGTRTSIIGDIRGAGWQDDAIIDAIRVRVAGVERYDGAGIAAVSAAAREIEELGYTATLVAGSHSATVDVSVDDYAFGTTDASVDQRVGKLGVVEQRWTVLGPAAGLSSAVGTGMMLLLNTVLLAVLGLLALTEFGAVSARRRDAVTLRELGWSRSRIAGWFAGEQLIGLLLLAGVGAIALGAAPEPAIAAPFVAAGLIGVAVICAVATVRATRPAGGRTVGRAELERSFGAEYRPEARIVGGAPHGHDPSGRGTASAQRRLPGSAVSWGIQRAWRTPAVALPMAFAVLTAMATVAAFALAMAEISGQGARLSVAAQFVTAAPQLLLALCGVAVAAVLAVRSRGQAAREGRRLRVVLEATGWPNEERRRATLAASLAVTLASVLLGSYLLWFALGALGVTAENVIVSAALVAGIVVAALILVPLPARRGAFRFTRKVVVPDGDAA